jgi:hypothetical protein
LDDASAAAGDGGGAGAGSSSGAAAAAVMLRQRWFYTGPGHPLHHIEDGLRHGCNCEVMFFFH